MPRVIALPAKTGRTGYLQTCREGSEGVVERRDRAQHSLAVLEHHPEFFEIVSRCPKPDGKADLVGAHETGNLLLRLVVVQRRGHEDDAPAPVLLVGFDEHRQFRPTRTAPGGPEIQHYWFTPIVAETHTLPVRVLQRQFRFGRFFR